jgi:hypothetical protein
MRSLRVPFALAALAAAPAVLADEYVRAVLGASSVVPAVVSDGSGNFEATIRPALGSGVASIEYTLAYQGLRGGRTTAAYIQVGQPAAAGGVAVTLCGDAAPACPSGFGTVAGTILAEDVIGPSPQGVAPGDIGGLIAALVSGRAYLSVRTSRYRRGEIRGQIQTVFTFQDSVVPLFTAWSCTACHAAVGCDDTTGRPRLRLTGSAFDAWNGIVNAPNTSGCTRGGGSRVSAAQPRESRLLRKATGADRHAGGAIWAAKADCSSPGTLEQVAYCTVLRWIQAGAPFN